jgi:hypothetical protein
MKDKAPQTVSFIIVSAQPPKIESLGIYVSPSFERIPNIAPAEICDIDDPECQGGTFPWAKFFIAMGVLIFVFLIAYVVAQEWYKKKYQAHLFKNPDELYNVINFIYNSRVSGMKPRYPEKASREKNGQGSRLNLHLIRLTEREQVCGRSPYSSSQKTRKLDRRLRRTTG